MGLRFRKSIKMGPGRINLSKTGVGFSVGNKYGRVTKTANGRTRTTISAPGTGLSYVDESSGKKRSAPADPYDFDEMDDPLLASSADEYDDAAMDGPDEFSEEKEVISPFSESTNNKIFSYTLFVLCLLIYLMCLLISLINFPVGLILGAIGIAGMHLSISHLQIKKGQEPPPAIKRKWVWAASILLALALLGGILV